MPIRTPKIYHSKRTNTDNTNIPSRHQCSAQKTHSIQQITPHGASQTQHHPTTMMPAAPPTQTPRSLRYSQRSSNLTRRSHNSVGSMLIPSPNPSQTTAIECTMNLHLLSSLPLPHKTIQQIVHGIHTPHTTKKRKRSQIVSQQHLLKTQNVFPFTEHPTNSQSNKRITRSHTACHNHPTTQTLTQTTTSSILQDNCTTSSHSRGVT